MAARGAQTSYTRYFELDLLPALDRIDMLIAMGGPMSVNDEAALPWLGVEKQFVRDAVARDIPVLGVCLGAQIIASALGARVFRSPVKKIGWFPIHGVSTSQPAFRFPSECVVFHWHGETFDLPVDLNLIGPEPEKRTFVVPAISRGAVGVRVSRRW